MIGGSPVGTGWRGYVPTLPAVVCVLTVGQVADWLPARPGYEWSFPRDHWSHTGYKTEWWYLTGALAATDDPTRRFGYQFTFFRIGLRPDRPAGRSAWATRDMIMGHLAVSDLNNRSHVFSEVLYRTTPFLGGFGPPGDPVIAWSRAPPGTDTRWTLSWNGRGFDFEAQDDAQGLRVALQTEATKPLTLHGVEGYSRKGSGPTAASLYYSLPRLETVGVVALAGEEARVRGESWMDKEFGSNQLGDGQIGWDWFSVRLDDGRDYMLYLLRDESGALDYAAGSAIAKHGATTMLTASDFRVTVTKRWRSPESGAVYPSSWLVTIPGEHLELEIAPAFADQEVITTLVPGLHYWEGIVDVRSADGRRVGTGYVELTGYGTRARPAI